MSTVLVVITRQAFSLARVNGLFKQEEEVIT